MQQEQEKAQEQEPPRGERLRGLASPQARALQAQPLRPLDLQQATWALLQLVQAQLAQVLQQQVLQPQVQVRLALKGALPQVQPQ